MRWLPVAAVAVVSISSANADPAIHRFEIGAGIGGVEEVTGFTGTTSYAPGPAISLAYERGAWLTSKLAFIGHFGLAVTAHTVRDSVGDDAGFPMDASAHGMLEYHVGPVALGAGIGVDVTRNTAAFEIPEASLDLVIGANAQIITDVARLDGGTLGVFVGATKVQLGGLVFGSYEHQDYVTATAGITYRLN